MAERAIPVIYREVATLLAEQDMPFTEVPVSSGPMRAVPEVWWKGHQLTMAANGRWSRCTCHKDRTNPMCPEHGG